MDSTMVGDGTTLTTIIIAMITITTLITITIIGLPIIITTTTITITHTIMVIEKALDHLSATAILAAVIAPTVTVSPTRTAIVKTVTVTP